MLGFETVGNATVVVHDGKPLLVTDPWLQGGAYFGSWAMSHEIPPDQRGHIAACRYVWISHGHPDHLSGESLELLRGKKILLADHAGSRIARDLRELGFDVQVLPSKRWLTLSPRVRVQTLPDYNQDSILLIELDREVLIQNINDAHDRGWWPYVRRLARGYPEVFLLRINGWGDATMINLFAEDGSRLIPPHLIERKQQGVGALFYEQARVFGADVVVPFSSMHQYQRRDSAWANDWIAPLEDYREGFPRQDQVALTEPYIRYDHGTGELQALDPRALSVELRDPAELGDDWSVPLEEGDIRAVRDYFARRPLLEQRLRFVRLVVGGKELTVDVGRSAEGGVTFELPRGSLMQAIEWEVFDDLFIGNYMKTTLHGGASLKDVMAPLLYGDNGRVSSREELQDYMKTYRRLYPAGFLRHALVDQVKDRVRQVDPEGSPLVRAARKLYRGVRAL
ncbi:MAG TPA: hypothetical protein DEA08_19130 [Planctomycetes bacterium]|nr:hypothetical protein [Planctomycetota bacterium]